MLLAMSAGRPVGIDRLVELLWPDERPERVRPSLQTLVARARAEVPGDAIVTTANGYLLDVEPDDVDLLRFRRLVRDANAAAETETIPGLLDQALELWRGAPLGEIRSPALERDLVPGLIDELISALCRWADLNLARGRHDRVITELRDLASRYPLREPLWAHLIRALAGAGRRAEAIEQYHQARAILAAELGVDPSPDLQDLHLQLLQSDRRSRSAPSVEDPGVAADRASEVREERRPPRQLPAGTVGFVGRAGQLKLLNETADQAVGSPGAVGISVISGMAGVGKTALAAHWAHLAAGNFADGQLYADLRGFGPSGDPAAPTEVICRFLDALGVQRERIPVGVEAQAGLYRTLLAERRVLIVLDNARDVAQVLPLLPGSAGCMAVVTSRNPLTSLAASYGAQLISLDVLSVDEADELLATRLGTARMAAGRETSTELATLCGRLPLALAITAARAAARPAVPLASFTAELRDTRRVLDVLDAGDPGSNLRAVFSWSCEALSGQATEMLLLLSIHPGPDISLPAAASLAGFPVSQAGAAMRELVALHLVTEHRRGRYLLHALLRAYAAEEAEAIISSDQRQLAIGRTLDHYLTTGRDGDAILNPISYPNTISLAPARDGCVPEVLGNRRQAMEWFEAEHRVLIAVTALAAGAGFDNHAWQIPFVFYHYLDWHGYWDDWDEVQRTARAASERLGDKASMACVNSCGGRLRMRLGDFSGAHDQYRDALDSYVDLGEVLGQIRAHGDLSVLFAIKEQYREAMAHSERALELAATAGNPHLHASALAKVGRHAVHLGDYGRALANCEQALALQRKLDNRHSEAFVWDSLGYIHQQLQRPDRSVECFLRAVSLFREIGNPFELAATLDNLGDAYSAAGCPDSARESWQQAIAIFDSLHHPGVAAVRHKMDGHAADITAPCAIQSLVV